MASKTTIANMALSHLGNAKQIINVETEKSAEADAFRVFYDVCLERVLRERDWPFAQRTAPFPLVTESSSDLWMFAYRVPNDCVAVRKIMGSFGYYVTNYRSQFEIGSDDQGKLVFCNDVEPVFRYTKLVTAIDFYPPDFLLAFSFLLAAMIAPRVTGGDPFKLGDRAMANYLAEISKAAVHSFSEGVEQTNYISEFITARN